MEDAAAASRFCEAVTEFPSMSNATTRIAAWLIGAAKKTDGFPIELSVRQIREGFTKGSVVIAGTGCRSETIKSAIEWLEANAILESSEGRPVGFGHHSRIYKIKV